MNETGTKNLLQTTKALKKRFQKTKISTVGNMDNLDKEKVNNFEVSSHSVSLPVYQIKNKQSIRRLVQKFKIIIKK